MEKTTMIYNEGKEYLTTYNDFGYWDKIAKANNEMDLFELERSVKNKKTGQWETVLTKYAEVKERVIAFRKVFPLGAITTEKEMTENYIEIKATISNNGEILSTGRARELANKSFALETAETSAIGRALGFCGFGVKTSIASAEDMKAFDESKNFDGKQIEDTMARNKEAIEKFNKLNATQKSNILNVMRKTKPEDIPTDLLEELVRNAK